MIRTESPRAKRILHYVVFTNALSPHILSYIWCLLSTLPPQQQTHPRASQQEIHRWQHTDRIFQCAFLNGSVTFFLTQFSFSVSLPHWRAMGSVHAGGVGGVKQGERKEGRTGDRKRCIRLKLEEMWLGMLLLHQTG
jgi:hypothetical protein